MSLLGYFGERKQQRIDRDVLHQARYVVRSVQAQASADQSPPFAVYARVRGLSPEDTAQQVGRAALNRLEAEFLLDAQAAERASDSVRAGAMLHFVQIEEA